MDKLPLHEDPAVLADMSVTHEQVAASAFGVPVEQVTKAQRNWAKTRRWVYLYSTPARTLNQAMLAGKSLPRLPRMDAELARRYMNDFKQAYPEVFLALDKLSGKYTECILPKPQNPITMPEPGSFGAAADALHEEFRNRPVAKSGKSIVFDSLRQLIEDKKVNIVTVKEPTFDTGRLTQSEPDIQNFPGTLAHSLEMAAARGGFHRGAMQIVGGRMAGRLTAADVMFHVANYDDAEARIAASYGITRTKARKLESGFAVGRTWCGFPSVGVREQNGEFYVYTHGGQQIAKRPIGYNPEPEPPYEKSAAHKLVLSAFTGTTKAGYRLVSMDGGRIYG